MSPEQQNNIELTDTISKKLIQNAINQMNEFYSEHDYHKRNPHLLPSFIEMQKAVYVANSK